MEVVTLSQEDLCVYLAAVIDDSSLEKLKENEIDGESLLMLIEDIDEFTMIIPKAVSRLRIKKFVKEFSSISCNVDPPGKPHCSEDGTTSSAKRRRVTAESSDESDNESIKKEACELNLHDPVEQAEYTEQIDQISSNLSTGACNISSSEEKQFDINSIVLPSYFSKKVQDSIDNGTLGKQENRLAFIRECVNYFQSYLERPSAAEYEAISKKILEKYPVLKNPNNTKYWRYRNNRRASTKVTAPKIILAPSANGAPSPGPSHTLSQLSGSQTSCHDVEYQENVTNLSKLMQGKHPPSAQAVMQLLDATRPKRVQWLKELVSISDILGKFPCFKTSKWLLYEFNKVCNDDVTAVEKNWLKVCETLLPKYDNMMSDEQKVLQIVEKNIYHKKPQMLPITLATGGSDLSSNFRSSMMEPRLVVFHNENSLQMFICAENEVILEVPSSTKLVDGFVHLMAMYHVFDIQYPAFCKSTLFFLQDILMGKPDSTKRPTRYTTFIQNNLP